MRNIPCILCHRAMTLEGKLWCNYHGGFCDKKPDYVLNTCIIAHPVIFDMRKVHHRQLRFFDWHDFATYSYEDFFKLCRSNTYAFIRKTEDYYVVRRISKQLSLFD